MPAFDLFAQALPYADFLTQYGTPADHTRWDAVRAGVIVTDEQKKLLSAFKRTTNVLFLAGAWCGDCSGQCPIMERFAEIAPTIVIRYLDRDAYPAVQAELTINGGNRVPVAVFYSEDGQEVARYGERTLSKYRRMVSSLLENVLPDPNSATPAEHASAIVADWLREIERVQWILRLSPRLRRLHAD